MQILDFFCTESQAAKELGVNRITVWRWIKNGRFAIQRIGRVVFIPKWEIEILKESVKRN